MILVATLLDWKQPGIKPHIAYFFNTFIAIPENDTLLVAQTLIVANIVSVLG